MKAMILAAGRGERMRPLTDYCPKPLLKVGANRLIEYHIMALAKAGVYDVIINHAYLGEQIEQFLGNGDRYNVCIHYSAEHEALETGGGIFKALSLLGDEPFILVNGDVWTDFEFESLMMADCLQKKDVAHLVMITNPAHNLKGDFAIDADTACLSKNEIAGENCLTYSGIGLYHPALFDNCEPGRFALAPLLIQYMNTGRITGRHYEGKWVDVGTPQRLHELDEALQA